MIDLDALRLEREKCIGWKNTKPYWEAVTGLPNVKEVEVKLGDTVEVYPQGLTKEEEAYIYTSAKTV